MRSPGSTARPFVRAVRWRFGRARRHPRVAPPRKPRRPERSALAARRVIATAPRVVEGPFGVVHGGCMVTDHVAGGGEMVVVRPGHRRLAEAFNRLLMAQQQGEVLLETSKEEQRNVLTKNDLVAPALANPGQQALDMDQGFTQGGC